MLDRSKAQSNLIEVDYQLPIEHSSAQKSNVDWEGCLIEIGLDESLLDMMSNDSAEQSKISSVNRSKQVKPVLPEQSNIGWEGCLIEIGLDESLLDMMS